MQALRKIHQCCPSWAILIISAPIIYIVLLISRDPWWSILSRKLPMFIVSGKIFFALALCMLSWYFLTWFIVWAIGQTSNWPRCKIAMLLSVILGEPTYRFSRVLIWSFAHSSSWGQLTSIEFFFILTLLVMFFFGWSYVLLLILPIKIFFSSEFFEYFRGYSKNEDSL